MASRNRGHRVLPAALSRTGARRSTTQKVRYLSVIDDNCELNALALIEKAKASATFRSIKWDAPIWDLPESEGGRSHKGRDPKLHFTVHRVAFGSGSRTGEPFGNESRFADLVKAIIRVRAEIGGQGANNHEEVIIAFRYIYDQLLNIDADLKRLSREHLDAAAKEVKKRETEVSRYKRIQRIEEIARLLDENGLVRVKLDWRCSANPRPESLRDRLLDDALDETARKSKLPSDGIIEAVAHLYHRIPGIAWVDRVRICFVSLLVITGFRIGELLTLPARRVQVEDDTGRRYIVYYPEKGAPPQKKWLMTAGGVLAEEMVDELLKLTAEPRAMAKWLHDNPGSIFIDGLDLTEDRIQIFEIGSKLKIAGGVKGARQFLNAREIEILGEAEEATVSRDRLIEALRTESYGKPVNVVKGTGEKLLLHEALACAFGNAFHATRATLQYAAVPITEQQLSDFIRARAGQPAAFERYGIVGPDGSALNVASHAFRHWLNDLLDRGGLSDVEQAVYFGRLNPKDNRAYQHKTPGERVRQARKDLKGGSLLGPVAELIARLPVDRQDIVLAARVQAVHVVPGGACFHQFSQSPCPNQMACTDGCGDFHWQTDDPIEVRELTYQKSILEIAVDTARREVTGESWGADNWLQHNLRKLDQVNVAMADCEAAPEEDKR